MTVRHNYIDALNDIMSTLSTLPLPDAFYRYVSDTNSTVGQLNSTFGKGVNEFRLTYTRVRDHRDTRSTTTVPADHVTLTPGLDAIAGTEHFSGRNAIDQDIIELNDAYTMLKGKPHFTIGTHNEFLKLGTCSSATTSAPTISPTSTYSSRGLRSSSTTASRRRAIRSSAPRSSVNQFGAYAGDQWRVSPNVTLTYGLRLDAPMYPTKPVANPVAVTLLRLRTEVVPNDLQWSPRAGFNWDLSGNGMRADPRRHRDCSPGRPAYVWISNQFANTGIEFTRIGASFNNNNRIPVRRRSVQPAEDRDWRDGRIVRQRDRRDRSRFQVSVHPSRQRRLGSPAAGAASSATFEFVWSKTLKDIEYQNLNFAQLPGVTGSGGRAFFARTVHVAERRDPAREH